MRGFTPCRLPIRLTIFQLIPYGNHLELLSKKIPAICQMGMPVPACLLLHSGFPWSLKALNALKHGVLLRVMSGAFSADWLGFFGLKNSRLSTITAKEERLGK